MVWTPEDDLDGSFGHAIETDPEFQAEGRSLVRRSRSVITINIQIKNGPIVQQRIIFARVPDRTFARVEVRGLSV